MAAIANRGFEIEGQGDGLAESWVVAVGSAPILIAGFLRSQNLLRWSEKIDNGVWLGQATVTADQAVAPDGTNTADKIAEVVASGLQGRYNNTLTNALAGEWYTASASFKAGTQRYAVVYCDVGPGAAYAIADLQTGVITATPSIPIGTVVDALVAQIRPEGGGWYRLRVSFRFALNTAFFASFGISNDGAATSYAGDTSKHLFLWRAALVRASSQGPALRTEAAAITNEIGVEDFGAFWGANEDFFETIEDAGTIAPTWTSVTPIVLTADDFEEGWSTNEGFAFALGATTVAAFDSAPEDYEDFEEEWSSNESFAFVLGAVTAASFDTAPEDYEDFEEGWANDSFVLGFGGGDVTAANFDNPAEAYEDFEEVKAPVVIAAVDPATDTITATGHGHVNGDVVRVRGGAIPGGLNLASSYFVIGATANTLQLSATAGGAAVDLTSPGAGDRRIYGDPSVYWTALASTV